MSVCFCKEAAFGDCFLGGGSNPLIRIFPSPGGRGEIRDVYTLPQGRGVFFNGFDPLPFFAVKKMRACTVFF
jgi:hypothetical protein